MKNNNNILNNNEIRQDLHTTNRDNGDITATAIFLIVRNSQQTPILRLQRVKNQVHTI